METLVEHLRDVLGREYFHPRGRQFDGQRNPIEPSADFRDMRDILIRQRKSIVNGQGPIGKKQ